MKPSKTNHTITIMLTLTLMLFCSLIAKAQVTQDCTYGTQLNKIDHFLDSITASKWIMHYQAYIDSVNNGSAKFNTSVLPNPQESFNRRLMQQILDVTGCIGERIFIGINDNEKMVAILGGIDSCGNTLYITNDIQTTGTNDSSSNNQSSILPGSGGDKGLGEFGQYP